MYKTLAETKWWLAMENSVDIQILPASEEDDHQKTVACKCRPSMKKDFRNKRMVIHNAFDGREKFDEYESSGMHNLRQTQDA